METITTQIAMRDRLQAHVYSRVEAARHAAAIGQSGACIVHMLDALAALTGELERLDALLSRHRFTLVTDSDTAMEVPTNADSATA